MNSSFNNRLSNNEEKLGNVAGYFENLAGLVQVNDGKRSFSIKTVDCHDQSAPFNDSQETRIAITHSDHMISQITDGFLTFKIRLLLQLTGVNQNQFNDEDHICKLFVGFKSSNQILDQLQILCRNMNTGYQQNECVREGFAYSTIKPKQEKKTKKFTHSLYENVSYYSSSVCGTYINIADFKDGLPHPVEFEANLPFDDILALQAFDLYPNRKCGDIELKFYVKPKGLVWTMIDPLNVKNYKEYVEGLSIPFTTDKNLSAMFTHGFCQINNSSDIINQFNITQQSISGENVRVLTAEKGSCRLSCTGMTILLLKSTMYGFDVVDSTMQKIDEIFSTPQIIPSQQLDYNAFPIAATAAGIQSTINMPLTNTTCISILFPKHDNDYTVFENPIYNNLQLTVNGKNMPDEPIDSLSARFLQQNLVASDLDNGLECTKEFEDSIVMVKNTKSGTKYSNSLSDGTSFMWNVQTERNNAGYTFDGIDTDGQNVAIQIKGQPLHTGENDSYYNFNGGVSRPPPPQIWLCRDTYFLCSKDGLKYVSDRTPENKIITT